MSSSQFDAYNDGITSGVNAGKRLTAKDTYDYLKKEGILLSPQNETALMQKMSNESATDQSRQAASMTAFSAGMTNAAKNLNSQRDLIIGAQTNAANNVANQLRELGNARNTNANAINNAMNAGISMFK